MILWGAIWGAILSVLTSRWGEWNLFAGALLGALAGWTLRKSIRSEITAWTKRAGLDRQSDIPTQQRAPMPLAESQQTTPTFPQMAAEAAPVSATLNAAAESASSTSAPATTSPPNANNSPLAVTSPSAQAEAAPQPAAYASANYDALHQSKSTPNDPDVISTALAKAKAWLLGGNTVARVGAIVLFIGLAFLAKWAADNSLFPPELRLAGIGIVGIALLAQGFRLARADADDVKRINYAVLLQGLGVAVLYLTVFAAFKLYAFIAPMAAFALMAIVCALSTLLALLQDKQPLALVGFAGAFATPILLSTGEGNHVALFSYYLLLNVAIGVVAWLRAWRALNLLGFVSTFLVATLWGVLKYNPTHYASTQPFLIAFFVIYVLIGLFYALRHSSKANNPLDGMLIFGTPIVSFALQTQLVSHYEYGAAISAVIASAIYVLLAFFVRSRTQPVAQWLTLSYAALALVFATLAVPLALDGRLTAAVWAIEGAGVFWLASKQGRWMGQAFGAAMQLLAAMAFAQSFEHASVHPTIAFANSEFVGAMMLAIGGLLISWWTFRATVEGGQAFMERPAHHERSENHHARDSTGNGSDAESLESRAANAISAATSVTVTSAASTLFFLVGFAWVLYGVWNEVLASSLNLGDAARLAWFTFSGTAITFAAFFAWKKTGWTSARYPTLAVLPFLLFCASIQIVFISRASLWLDLLLWPLCFALHLYMLRNVDALSPQRWWRIVHIGNTLLVVLLIGGFLNRVIVAAELRHTDWAHVIMLVASTFVMLALTLPRVWAEPSADADAGWPLDRFQPEYALHAGLGVAVLTTLSALIVACFSRGSVAPLPYVPLLNPVDLSAFLALGSVALWIKRLRDSEWVNADSMLRKAWLPAALAFAAFIVVNTVWLRFAHHFHGVAWSEHALASSFFVQAGYSVLWTLLGVTAMFIAHRKGLRVVWHAGAALLALTVLKLLLIDLANSGGGERIVAFIGVGVLMVAVGYFAPMPPADKEEKKDKLMESGDGKN
jgi:uncharacterized membrane protein